MPYDRRTLNRKIDEAVGQAVNQRDRFVSADEAERITRILPRAKHIVPIFSHSFFSKNFSSEELNRGMDYIYTDHSIMMRDLEILYTGLQEQYERINQRFVQPRLTLKSSISLVRNFINAKALNETYNFVDTFSMSTAINTTLDENPLRLDKSTGALLLDTAEEINYTDDAEMDVKVQIVSGNTYKFEEATIDNLFDPWFVYYVTAYTNAPDNTTTFPEYDGIIVAIDIILPSQANINIARVRLVSDVNQDILGLSYFVTLDTSVPETVITEYSVVNNGFVHEVEFNSTNLRVLRIYIGSRIHEQLSQSTEIKGQLKPTFIKEVEEEIRRIQIEEASFGKVEEDDVKTRLSKAINEKDINIPAGTKVYTCPIRNITVSRRKYKTYGVFVGGSRLIDGNLTFVKLEAEVAQHNSVSTVFKIVIDNKEYTIADINDDDTVTDVATVVLEDVTSVNNKYSISTNLIPDLTQPIEVYSGVSLIPPAYVNISTASNTLNGIKFTVSAESGLIEDTNVILKYTPAAFDRNGVTYNPSSLDIIQVIGKPNVKDTIFANLSTNFVYFYDAAGDLVMYHYDNVTFDETPDLFIGPTGEDSNPIGPLGEDLTGIAEQFSNVNNEELWRITEPYYGLYDGGYVFIEDSIGVDAGVDYVDAPTSITVNTTEAYARGMLVVFQGDSRVIVQDEYASGVNGKLGPRADYTSLVISKSNLSFVNPTTLSEPLSILYMPVPLSDGSFPISTRNNIEFHNRTDTYTLETDQKKIRLSKYPFVDQDITQSSRFVLTRGIYYFKEINSILYEPFNVFLNNRKLEYLKDFTIEGRDLLFTEDVAGSVVVKYYTMADNISYKVEMFRSIPTVNDRTTRILSILGLSKTTN